MDNGMINSTTSEATLRDLVWLKVMEEFVKAIGL